MFQQKPNSVYGEPDPGIDVLWRCDARRYSIVVDPDADLYTVSTPKLELRWYLVTKRTPCGAWIGNRFVKLTAHKKWACNTKDEAITSFSLRKKKQIAILQSKLCLVKEELALVEKS